MAIEKKSFKKMFPNLYREIEGGDCKLPIDGVRKNAEEAENAQASDGVSEPQQNVLSDKFRHFNPSAEDFIRRCDTEEQAEEIIAFLEKKGELTKEEAEKLRCQLKCDGLRSFGEKKEENHYFREGGIN